MNLFDPPPGSTATVCTITNGLLQMHGQAGSHAILNLNNLTLNITGSPEFADLDFFDCDVTTNLNYDAGRMGNITVGGVVSFSSAFGNTLTQGFTGTPRAISLPLITATGGIGGDFEIYVLQPGMNDPVKTETSITLSRN